MGNTEVESAKNQANRHRLLILIKSPIPGSKILKVIDLKIKYQASNLKTLISLLPDSSGEQWKIPLLPVLFSKPFIGVVAKAKRKVQRCAD